MAFSTLMIHHFLGITTLSLFPDLLYFTIVHIFVFGHNIISINTYTTIQIHVFLILSFSVECLSIYVISLICYNGEYRATSLLFRYSFVWVSDWDLRSWSQPMNFLTCSFANQDSWCPGFFLRNTTLCSSKYSETMDICSNMWKWARRNKIWYGVITFFLMAPLHVSLPSWRDSGTPIRLLESVQFRAHSMVYSV
jgi:hypothetical protein